MDTDGKEFANFWSWTVSKGRMNDNTAKSLAAAVRQVMSIDEDWETKDVKGLDVDDLLQRFKNKRAKDFKPESLNAYERRFRQAHGMFLQYIQDPSGWKPKTQTSTSRKPKPSASGNTNGSMSSQDIGTATPSTANMPSLVEYPYPLRDNCVARLRLPSDLKIADVERLAAFMRTLALDFNPSHSSRS